MSWCRRGGRDVYRPEVVVRKRMEAVYGRINFADAEPLPIAFSRYLEDGTERVVTDVEIGGRRFVERPPRDWDDLED